MEKAAVLADVAGDWGGAGVAGGERGEGAGAGGGDCGWRRDGARGDDDGAGRDAGDARLAEERPDILIGAGTVLDAETARMCILEGAQFVVSPALNVKTIEMCHRYSVAVLPGALTPTEIVTAWQAGADVVKVFPASAMGGAKYLKSLKAPLPQVELIPTGGVSLATARSCWRRGRLRWGWARTWWMRRR